MTKDEAQRRRWTFYEAVKKGGHYAGFWILAVVLVVFFLASAIKILRSMNVVSFSGWGA